MKNWKNSLVLSIIAVFLVAAMAIGPVYAQGTLFVNPSSIIDPTVTEFSITVEIDAAVLNLWGYEFKLWYNTTVLNATGYTLTTEFPDVAKAQIDDAQGLVWFAASLPSFPPPTEGIDGPLTLVTIDFLVEGTGESYLDIDEPPYTLLVNLLGEVLDVTIVDGYFSNIVHDIAITGVTASPTLINVGDPVSIDVTVANEGDFDETFNVTISHDGIIIETRTDVSLASGDSTTIGFTWDTTGLAEGSYLIRAEAIVDEDYDSANNEKSVEVTIGFDYPVASFTYSPTEPIMGETVTFTSTSTDPDGTIENWDWDFGDGTSQGTGETTTHAYTAAGDYTVTLTVTDNDGLTDNATESITIAKLSSSVSIDASPSTFTAGKTTTISGSITPTRVGATVTIEYKPNGGTWSTLATVTTDDDSQYSYDWKPESVGTYEVKASWLGDENHHPDESDVLNVKVEEAQDILLYALAGIAIVIVAAIILVYVFKIRKPKPT